MLSANAVSLYTAGALQRIRDIKLCETRMWADAQRDGRPVKYRLCPLLNAAKFG